MFRAARNGPCSQAPLAAPGIPLTSLKARVRLKGSGAPARHAALGRDLFSAPGRLAGLVRERSCEWK